jgi:hypothetical protein
LAKLYCGNLVLEVGDRELRELFQSAGCEKVEAHVFCEETSGASRGFASVHVRRGDAVAALSLNEREYRGRKLIVRDWIQSAHFTQARYGKK